MEVELTFGDVAGIVRDGVGDVQAACGQEGGRGRPRPVVLLHGRECGVFTEPGNEDEWRKQITSSLLSGDRLILVDNVEHPLGSPALLAAGLLAAIGSGPYTVTKAAAVKLAEFIAITHGDDGIRVSVLCPQGVNTAMAPRGLGDGQTDGIIEPEALALTVVEALREERFHVLPHPEVEEYVRRKGDDVDRWLHGMRRLRRQAMELAGEAGD